MEPITLLILGGLAFAAFTAKKKGDKGPKTITWVLEDLQGAERNAVVRGGDTILVKLPGVVENYSLDISSSASGELEDFLNIEKIGPQGAVIYKFGIRDVPAPWLGTVNILGNKG